MNWKLIFNMPGREDVTQKLIISSPTRDQALVDAGYLSRCYNLHLIQVSPATEEDLDRRFREGTPID